jgi:hypothetical protein
MHKTDMRMFAALMAALSEVFDSGREVSKVKMDIYYESLKEFDVKTLEVAVKRIIKGRVYASFPKPAEIIQEITGTVENQATLAWVKVLTAVKRHGNYMSVRFDDPVIHSVINSMGGWIQLGNMKVDETVWKQKEFEKLYLTIAPRGGKHPTYLPGIFETDNGARGFKDVNDVVCIGTLNQQKQIEGGEGYGKSDVKGIDA